MKNGPTTWASETTRAPCSSAATRCAAASWRDARDPSARSGCGTGRRAPRSGHVPTTTSAPRARRSSTAATRCRTDSATGTRCVTSLPPTTITATSGTYAVGSEASWAASMLLSEPTTAAVRSRTDLPALLAVPRASRPPSVCFAFSAPRPAAIESPRTRRSTGSPYPFFQCRSATGASSPSGLPIALRACAAWRTSSPRAPYAAPAPMPPTTTSAVPVLLSCLPTPPFNHTDMDRRPTPVDVWPNRPPAPGSMYSRQPLRTRPRWSHDRHSPPPHPLGAAPPARLAALRGRRLDLPGDHQPRPGGPHLPALPRRPPHPLQHRARPAHHRRRVRRHRPDLARRREPRRALPPHPLRRRDRPLARRSRRWRGPGRPEVLAAARRRDPPARRDRHRRRPLPR